jgi:cell division protein FtsB
MEENNMSNKTSQTEGYADLIRGTKRQPQNDTTVDNGIVRSATGAFIGRITSDSNVEKIAQLEAEVEQLKFQIHRLQSGLDR